MAPENGINNERVKYFDLEDYVSKIKLTDDIKEHLKNTTEEFYRYTNLLANYPNEVINTFLVNSFKNEVCANTSDLDNELYDDFFFTKDEMNHDMLRKAHSCVFNDGDHKYRTKEAYVGKKNEVYWHTPYPEDIIKFMDKFIEIYKNDNYFEGENDPFISSFLSSLLLIRIQAFKDGNKRTSRLIQNIKFTDKINELYGSSLVLSPINLSKRLYSNMGTYAKCMNNIYFDMEHENNEEINNWFNFHLDMCDEQLYYLINNLKNRKLTSIYKIDNDNSDYTKIYEKSFK